MAAPAAELSKSQGHDECYQVAERDVANLAPAYPFKESRRLHSASLTTPCDKDVACCRSMRCLVSDPTRMTR